MQVFTWSVLFAGAGEQHGTSRDTLQGKCAGCIALTGRPQGGGALGAEQSGHPVRARSVQCDWVNRQSADTQALPERNLGKPAAEELGAGGACSVLSAAVCGLRGRRRLRGSQRRRTSGTGQNQACFGLVSGQLRTSQ